MATHVLPLQLEARLTEFAEARAQSPDEVLSAVLADFFAEFEANKAAAAVAEQRWQDHLAGKDRTYTLAELMEEDALES